MHIQGYTSLDAVYDIVKWQIPLAFLVAVMGVIYVRLTTETFIAPAGGMTRAHGYFCVGFVTMCWISTACVFVCMDLLIIPPVLALCRLLNV
jgi:hypothetical protein